MSHCQLLVLFLLTALNSAKKYNQLDFGNDHLVMSMCKVVS